jgi:hypothetical protein
MPSLKSKCTGLRTFLPENRAFETLKNFGIVADAILLAGKVLHGIPLLQPGAPGNFVTIEAKQFGLGVALPLGMVTSIVTKIQPKSIQIGFVNPWVSITGPQAHFDGTFALLTPYYVDFWEKYRVWIEKNQPEKPDQWAPPLNFGRMVRNFSHHHGKVHLRGDQPAVQWEHLSYSSQDEGKQAIGGDLFLGDLLLLIFEIGDTLESLGCPLDP